jgi:hypothetical protein
LRGMPPETTSPCPRSWSPQYKDLLGLDHLQIEWVEQTNVLNVLAEQPLDSPEPSAQPTPPTVTASQAHSPAVRLLG